MKDPKCEYSPTWRAPSVRPGSLKFRQHLWLWFEGVLGLLAALSLHLGRRTGICVQVGFLINSQQDSPLLHNYQGSCGCFLTLRGMITGGFGCLSWRCAISTISWSPWFSQTVEGCLIDLTEELFPHCSTLGSTTRSWNCFWAEVDFYHESRWSFPLLHHEVPSLA